MRQAYMLLGKDTVVLTQVAVILISNILIQVNSFNNNTK